MKASFILLAVLPALAVAHTQFRRQDGGIPACATSCIAQLGGGGCEVGDIACYCADPETINNIQGCLAGVCEGDDLQTAIDAAGALCADNGVTTSFEPQGSATDSAEVASVTDGDDIESEAISASIALITSAAAASASSARGALNSATSAIGASVSSAIGAASSSIAGAASSRLAASASSSSAAAASASSSGGATPTGRVGKGVVAGALMLVGGLAAGM